LDARDNDLPHGLPSSTVSESNPNDMGLDLSLDLGLAPEPAGGSRDISSAPRWKLLIVDDEPDIHAVTALALRDCLYDGQPLELLHAYTGVQAVQIMREQPDIAIVLMDVVMETEKAGLDAVHAIRVDQGNRFVRIVLRTGQPGQAPERHIVTSYDINDYKEKTELTSRKLFTMVYTSLGHYRQLLAVEGHRAELEKVVDELRRSNRDLKEFAFIASHDLSTPLRSIVGFSQLLEKRYSAVLSDEAKEFLDFIVQTTRRMKTLIDNLLAVAQVGSKRSAVSVSLDACLTQSLASLRVEIESSGAEIRSAALPVVDGIESEWVQVFTNLLANAIKFSRPGVSPVISIDCIETDGVYEIRVSDNGIGVADEHRPKLFQLFRRLHHQDEYEGTGMGLALCRKIVETLGGSIDLADSPLGGLSVVMRVNRRVNP